MKWLVGKESALKAHHCQVWFPERPLFGGINMLQKRFGAKSSVRCLEFNGVRFSEVANVLQVYGTFIL